MISGKDLGEAGFRYLGVPYSKMDCQAFAEQCLRDCGLEMNLAGSNAWYREVMKNGAILTPEECVKQLGFLRGPSFSFTPMTVVNRRNTGRTDLGTLAILGL